MRESIAQLAVNIVCEQLYTEPENAKDSRLTLTGHGAVMFADYDVSGQEIEEARALLKAKGINK